MLLFFTLLLVGFFSQIMKGQSSTIHVLPFLFERMLCSNSVDILKTLKVCKFLSERESPLLLSVILARIKNTQNYSTASLSRCRCGGDINIDHVNSNLKGKIYNFCEADKGFLAHCLKC